MQIFLFLMLILLRVRNYTSKVQFYWLILIFMSSKNKAVKRTVECCERHHKLY